MTLNLRQAVTSALVGGIAACIVSVVLHHGMFNSNQFVLAAGLGVAIGASRLIEVRKKR